MANYPSFAQLTSSDEDQIDDVVLDRAVAGGVKARSFFTAKKRAFKVEHLLSASDRSTLDTFYDTNRGLTVTFTWAKTATAYTCFMAGPPEYSEAPFPYTKATVRLVQQ